MTIQVIIRYHNNLPKIIQSNYLDENNDMLISEHKMLFLTTKYKDKVKSM